MKKFCLFLGLMMLFSCAEKAVLLDGQYALRNAPDNAEITIGFEDTRFFGKSAVNNYFGSFTTGENNTIKLSPAGSTMMAGPENLMNAEYRYLQDLEKINQYRLQGNTLILTGPENLILTFEKQ